LAPYARQAKAAGGRNCYKYNAGIVKAYTRRVCAAGGGGESASALRGRRRDGADARRRQSNGRTESRQAGTKKREASNGGAAVQWRTHPVGRRSSEAQAGIQVQQVSQATAAVNAQWRQQWRPLGGRRYMRHRR